MDKYGKDKAESILGNCAIKICLGNVNDTTAAYFSNLMGKATIKVETGGSSLSQGKSGSSSSSHNYSYSQRALMNADEILTMSETDSLVLIAGKYPIKAKKAVQFELFPGLVDKYEVSQMDYKRKISTEAQRYYENEVKKYDFQIQETQFDDYQEIIDIDNQNIASDEQDEILAQAREEIEMYQNSLDILQEIENQKEPSGV